MHTQSERTLEVFAMRARLVAETWCRSLVGASRIFGALRFGRRFTSRLAACGPRMCHIGVFGDVPGSGRRPETPQASS